MTTPAVIVCTPCLREGNTVDAIKFCIDCNENVCKPCLRNHIKSNANKGHQLIGNNEMPEWISSTASEVQFEENCTRHPDIILDKYCRNHDLLCCNKCSAIEHSSCVCVMDIADAAADVTTDTCDEIIQSMESISTSLKSIKDDRRKHQARSRKNTAEALASVRDFRKRLNDTFDELERRTVDEINTNCIDIDDTVESEVKCVDGMMTKLEACVKQLNTGSISDKMKFVRFQNGKVLIKEGNSFCNKSSQNAKTEINRFTIYPKIMIFANSLRTLGDFSVRPHSYEKLYLAGDINIATDDDVEVCDVKGSLQLKDGAIVLADYDNKKLKFLDESFNVVNSLDLSSINTDAGVDMVCNEPFAICSINDAEIAVTMERDKIVQLIKLNDTIVKTKVIDVGEYCRGVAYSHLYDELYVSCGGGSYSGEGLGHVRVYNLSGTRLRSFMKSPSGKQLTPHPMHIAVSEDGSKLHIADLYKGVITLDIHGILLSTFNVPELVEARGLCVDVSDDVIVCGNKSHNVIQIGKDGLSHTVLLEHSDGVRNPTSLCYDMRRSRIVVTMNSCNTVAVFENK